MGVFGRMKAALFGGGVASPQGMLQALFQTGQPPRRGSKEMLEAYKRLPWLHAVVRRIALDIAATQWKLYAPAKGGRKIKKDALGAYVGEDNLAEVESHPFLDMLQNPNPVLGRIGTFFLMQAFMDVKGECPIVIERATDGLPLELWPTPPLWLQAPPSATENYWRFNYAGWFAQIQVNGVMLMREPDLINPYARGVGNGDALADELDIDEFAAQHMKSWFFNRALPDAFLSVEGITSPTEALKFEEKIRAKHQGVGKAGQIHISPGKIDVTTISQTFKEQQLYEIRGAQRDIILQCYSMPPEVMGIIQNSNRATIDAAYYLYARGVLTPRLDAIAGYLTQLAQEWDPAFVVGFDSPVPEDKEFALKVMTAQPSLFTKNEWRGMADEEPVDGWDEEFVDKPAPGPAFGAPALPPGDAPAGEAPPTVEPAAPGDADEEGDEEGKSARRGRLLPLPRARRSRSY